MKSFNIPNTLSVFRIFLVPVFLYYVLNDNFPAATTVFVVAGLTDGIDGFIAKRFGQRTELGAYIDPAADKLLLLTAFLSLTFKGYVPVWLCVVVIFRDAVVLTGFGLLKYMGRKVEIAPSVFGKLSTVLEIITVVYVIALLNRYGADLTRIIEAITGAVTVYAAFDYAIREYRIQTRVR